MTKQYFDRLATRPLASTGPPNQEESVPALVLCFLLVPAKAREIRHAPRAHKQRGRRAPKQEHYSNHSPCFSAAIPLHTCTVAMAVVVVEAPDLVMSIRASFTKLLV